jgi:diguanylate cyclase (GGDEF)-like protein
MSDGLFLSKYLHSELQLDRLRDSIDRIKPMAAIFAAVIAILGGLHLTRPDLARGSPVWMAYSWFYTGAFILAVAASILARWGIPSASVRAQHAFVHSLSLLLIAFSVGLTLLDLRLGDDTSAYLAGLFALATVFRLPRVYLGGLFGGSALGLIFLGALLGVNLQPHVIQAIAIYAFLAWWMAYSLENERIRALALSGELMQRNEELKLLSSTDSLTGVFNRRSLVEKLELLGAQSARYHIPISLAMLDVDFFKRINDELGHTAGDAVLRQLAVRLAREVRRSDIVARPGGDEFLIAMPSTDLESAAAVAERLRLAIQEPFEIIPWPISASLGIVQFQPEIETIEQALGRADEAMYRSKQSGRNRVSLASMMAIEGETPLMHFPE